MVFAHFIVGNTRSFTVSDWAQDIALAASKGIDAFALNVGRDDYEASKVADAFTAAADTGFKLFLSFDMTSLPCSGAGDATTLRNYILNYDTHPSQLKYNGKSLVSTFGGEYCTFGTGNLNQGWMNAVKTGMPPIHFIPAFFIDPGAFEGMTVMDGAFNWNSGWPSGASDGNFDSDNNYVAHLEGRTYMANFSPWFFTHYGANSFNKNFIFRADDWHFSHRWELIIANRDVVGLVEAVTWNDFGESHYLGPRHGDQAGSEAWTNGYDHTDWLDLLSYYIEAYKTGIYPSIEKDRIFLWARLSPAAANAPDSVGKPNHWDWTQDYLWAVVLLTAPAQVQLSCGTTRNTYTVPAGLSRLQLPFSQSCSVQASVIRDDLTTLTLAPNGFNFQTNPSSYNFNAFVAASP
ncbi:glycoside hydrolase family 71 protein [Jaapia argillacea MUCL 33604]|uniref:Glycoside hydrolase family 71 protein n=1 Tax=Jaapia argillacea MUCL 33604 TaxID=933084 RepID=A0A067PYS1_9AGAM|nr:glycoside hydrolase family 71 protein [Jaapia argillacea MUCL 33604]